VWNAEQRQKLRDEVPKLGLAAKIAGRTVFEIAGELLKLARAGLERRKCYDYGGCDETRYLEVLEDRLARGTTPAEELLAKYHGEWGGSVDPIYTEEAY
jgi:glutamate--cysteine ligase